MTMQYVRDTYGVPAKRGRIVEVYYERYGCWALLCRGRITSASHHIHINGGGPYHPTYGVVYYDDDGTTVLLDTREDKT